jgi:hypothetical protein
MRYFLADDPTRSGLVLKVRNVDHGVLTDTLSRLGGVAILDAREI